MTKDKERRRSLRLRREERAVVRPIDTDGNQAPTAFYCSTIDISPRGIQILSIASLPPGAGVHVAIMLEGHNQAFYLAGRIKWCTRLQDAENHTLGIEFVNNGAADITSWRRIFN